jgi:23S rRNA (adenine2503-C2)-methyltransferase
VIVSNQTNCWETNNTNINIEEVMEMTQATMEELIPLTVIKETLSPCGTRKMLLRLIHDNLEIESVLIPSTKYDRTTLCVSTQVGCDRGCAFCLTGKMGLVRNLTSSEIIGQVIHGLEIVRREGMPILSNIVFMGMGDAGRNLEAVQEAVACLTDPFRLSFAYQKVTVSTVGPHPEVFEKIAKMNCTIAWSLHSANESIRQRLVHSSRSTPQKPTASLVELREGLLKALQDSRTRRRQTLMIALTLIAGINDSEEDAHQVADFVLPMLQVCRKIAIDLIPYNDIQVMKEVFRRPSREQVNTFQRILRERGLFCSVRLTRGDEENSACGMLATNRKPVILSTGVV